MSSLPELLRLAKPAVTVALLALFWGWETWLPFFGRRRGRLRHAARNLTLAAGNTALLALAFAAVTVRVGDWTEQGRHGLLHALDLGGPARFVLALVLLDGWTYLWHRANHAVPLLWRFHRMHHSDDAMDVTTATRFHVGEHVGSSVLRLGLIPLVGLRVEELLVYETLVVAVTMLHHANVSLGRWDRPLSWLVVTPNLHKVHHSRLRPETDSNYSTLLSVWDRLAGSLRVRPDPDAIVFGLDEFDGDRWQTVGGMLRTPFAGHARVRDGSPAGTGGKAAPAPPAEAPVARA
jgi:sterol desaturase/sphingolipid hydroxylase (fatty acid hydroxylase superfamily)